MGVTEKWTRSTPEPLIRTTRCGSPDEPERSEEPLVVGVLEEHDVGPPERDPVEPAKQRSEGSSPQP